MNRHTESTPGLRLATLRDVVSPLFRYSWTGVLVAMAVFLGTVVLVLLTPKQYEAEMKLLVKRGRANSIVSVDSNAAPQLRTDVSEDEVNSEVELLRSRALMEQVATASGLLERGGRGGASPNGADRPAAAAVVRRLQADVRVVPIKKTALIKVTYRSSDPNRAARVLNELARLYLERHLALHRPSGAYEFFTEQAERFHRELTAARARLSEYGRREDVVSGDLEQQATLQKLADFDAQLQQTRAHIAESARRMADIEAQIAATPVRHTTQIRTSDNAELTHELKSRVLDLEMRRSDMLRKFAPTYPPVIDLEEQLGQARAALQQSEESRLTEQTTDQNPTYQWLHGELARVRTERAAATARTAALERSVAEFRQRAKRLDEHAAAQQDLRRAAKSAEDHYLLYSRKQEEARISDALDRTRIANVAVADPPTVPTLPSSTGRSWLFVLGALMALALGIAATYVLQYLSPFFHTPDDVESALDVPVLVTLSQRQ